MMMKKQLLMKSALLLLAAVGGASSAFATDTTVNSDNVSDLMNLIKNANDGDALVFEAGTYEVGQMDMPAVTLTLKAAEGAAVTIKGYVQDHYHTSKAYGSLIFEGLKIIPSKNDFITFSEGNTDVENITFRNCEITSDGSFNKCLITGGNKVESVQKNLNSIVIDNCVIHDCGTSYNFIFTENIVKSVSVTNSTLYNYGGESLFYARTKKDDLAFSFTFTNNTVYQWANTSSNRRAFAVVDDKYSSSSVYTFKDNIIDGYKGYTEGSTVDNDNFVLVQTKNGGTINILNNIMLGFKNGTGSNKNNVVWGTGSPAITNTNYWPWDATLDAQFGFTAVPFASTTSGSEDFTIDVTSYPALATASTVGSMIGDPKNAKYTLTVGAAKAATLVLPFETTTPTGITAYTLTHETGATKVTAAAVSDVLPANTPVLINSEDATTYPFLATGQNLPAAAAAQPTVGALKGTYADYSAANGYVLQNQSGNLGFYPFNTTRTIKPYRAYLNVDPSTVSAPGLTIDFGDGSTTSIESIGQFDNQQSDNWYDLQGRQIVKSSNCQMAPGLYIVNGKKVIIK